MSPIYKSNRPLLDLDLLRALVAVVDSGGFTAAAARLHSTQSTVSQKLRRLEEQTGHVLLERSSRHLQPTEAGQRLLGQARQLLELNDHVFDSLEGIEVSVGIRLGVPDDFSGRATSILLAGFQRSHPQVKLEVTTGMSRDLSEAYDRGELDLALVKQRRASREAASCAPEPLVWVDSRSAPSLRRDPLPLVVFPGRGLYRAEMIDLLEQQGRRWQIAFTSASLAAVQSAVEAGIGISLLPRRTVLPGHRVLDGRSGFGTVHSHEIVLLQRTGADPLVKTLGTALWAMVKG